MANPKLEKFEQWFGKLNNLTDEEKEIGKLSAAAYKNGIIKDADSRDEGYCTFDFGNRKKYEVRFGANPNRSKHPNAERAIRASEFVSELLRIIDTSYNCFVVPALNISAPNTAEVGKRIFGDSLHEITLSDKSKTGNYTSNYELDVIISMLVGKNVKRIIDTLSVKVLHENNNITISYEHKHHSGTRKPVDRSEYQKDILSSADRKDLEYLLNHITGDNGAADSNENKIKILDALIASSDSNFYKSISSCQDNSVGQVTVRPSSIFVDAVPEKTFTYQVSRKEGKDKTYNLDFVWNKKSDALKYDTPLYIIEDEGKLQGLTFSPDYIRPDGKKVKCQELGPADRIVVGCKVEDGKTVESTLTLLLPAEFKSNVSNYKGIKDYAVKVSDVSEELVKSGVTKDAYYLHSETEILGDNRYLKADISECEYTKMRTWKANLVQSDYIDTIGNLAVIKNGRISADIPEKSCNLCESKFRAFNEYGKLYFNQHKLDESVLNGVKYYCDKCPTDEPIIRKAGSEERKYRLYKNIFSVDQTNQDIVCVDHYDVNATEHVLTCTSCGNKHVLYRSNSEAKYSVCGLCGRFLCNECYMSANAFEMQLGLIVCSDCMKFSKESEYLELAKDISQNESSIKKITADLAQSKEKFVDGVYGNIHSYMRFMTRGDRAYVSKLISQYKKSLPKNKKKSGALDNSAYRSVLGGVVEVNIENFATYKRGHSSDKDSIFACIKISVGRIKTKARAYYFTVRGGRIKFGREGM